MYLDFCLTTIRCVQTTVDYLSDGEKTRHGDLPYTNGYFIDFVDQVKHYASHLAIANESGADEAGGELDLGLYVFARSPLPLVPNILGSADEVKLNGGLAENGQPAELVRVKKDDTTMSMATGEPVGLDGDVNKNPIERKQSMTQDWEVEDEMQIVMARRKNNARPGEYAPHKCREPGCDRGFRRPVDLTKHEKTHSRPWKCPVSTCKYSEYGWPTEGELDRHVDSRHLAAPPLYECLYKPCPYKSKRDSNRKRHMEKVHGWTYVRTQATEKRMHDKTGGIPVYVSDDESRDIFKQPPPTADPDSLPLKQEHTPSTWASYSTSQDFPHFTPMGHIPPHPLDNSDFLADLNEEFKDFPIISARIDHEFNGSYLDEFSGEFPWSDMGWESMALNSKDDSGAPTPDEDRDVGVTGDETIPPSAMNEDHGEVDFEQQGGKDDETATAGEVGGDSTLPLSGIIDDCTPSSERESTHEQRRPSISASSVESFGTDMASLVDGASSLGTCNTDLDGIQQAALEELTELLLQAAFKGLLVRQISVVGPERFEANFSRLLRHYGANLRREASDNQENQAARFVFTRVSRIAESVRRAISGEAEGTLGLGARDGKRGTSRDMNEWLSSVVAETCQKEEVDLLPNPQAIDDEVPQTLESVRVFLVSSQAYKMLHDDIQAWLKVPQSTPRAADAREKAGKKAQALGATEPAKLEEDDNFGVVPESGQSRAWKFRAKLRRAVGAISDIILLQSRPDAGRVRVSWNCVSDPVRGIGKRLTLFCVRNAARG